MQAKPHRWAVADLGRRFDDVFDLVYDPAFLAAAWYRVRTNTGARTAGVIRSHHGRSLRSGPRLCSPIFAIR
jgi:RNA-directed DNA polymerase